MGPRQSSQPRSKQKQFLDNYQIIQQLPNDSIRFLEHKQTKKQYLLRELNYTSKQQYLKNIEIIKNKRQQLKNSDHVIPLTEYLEKQQDQYCSTFYKLYVLYEYPQRTLDDEINQRNLRNNKFTETEIWSILASCILGLSHLQKKGIRHASLKSSMIFLSQQGLIKISDPSTTGCQSNYQTLLNKRNTRHVYLSPEQCEALQAELISPANINPYKSDIFTLGMIILQCGLLQYQDECYRDEYSRIHIETLEYNKNRFRKSYSEELANMLNYMLGEDVSSRPEWIELENYVITDPSRSFISEGRKSHIFTHSKPVSVNLNHKIPSQDFILHGKNTQSAIHSNSINFQQKSTSQKPIVQQKPSYNPNPSGSSGKGIGISSFKPLSVQNFRASNVPSSSFVPIFPVQTNTFISEYKPVKNLNAEPQVSSVIKSFTPNPSVYQNYQPLTPLNPITVTNMANFAKLGYMAQSPVKNQILSKNSEIAPVDVSNISATRPFRSVFPNPTYVTKTKVDENLVQVDDEDQTSRSVSDLSQYNNINSEQFARAQNLIGNGQYNISSGIQTMIQSPYHGVNYNNKQSVTNFTAQSGRKLQSAYQSNQISQQNSPPHNQFSSPQPQFVIQTFKLGSRYEGYKLNGMRHGQGKFFYQDGGMYDGEWVKNKMEGFGKLYYQSGKIAYEGMWIQDQFTGQGVLYNQNPDPLNEPFNYENFDNVDELWTKYEGEFLQDSKNGKGILYLSNGQYFEGNFMNDTAQGEGVYTKINGDKIRGIWQMNLLQKQL